MARYRKIVILWARTIPSNSMIGSWPKGQTPPVFDIKKIIDGSLYTTFIASSPAVMIRQISLAQGLYIFIIPKKLWILYVFSILGIFRWISLALLVFAPGLFARARILRAGNILVCGSRLSISVPLGSRRETGGQSASRLGYSMIPGSWG